MMHAENQQDFYDYPLAAIMASEQVDVTLPAVVSVDGFFCTHARGPVKVTPEEYKLPPRDGWRSAVPAMDNENPPARISRDAPIQKSNFISYHMHSSWQQEVFAAVERSAKYFRKYLGSLVEVVNPGAEDFIAVMDAAHAVGVGIICDFSTNGALTSSYDERGINRPLITMHD